MCRVGAPEHERCTNPVQSRGLCAEHLTTHGDVNMEVVPPKVCEKAGCELKVYRHNLCYGHFNAKVPRKLCSTEGCSNLARKGCRVCDKHIPKKICYASQLPGATECDNSRVGQPRGLDKNYCKKHRPKTVPIPKVPGLCTNGVAMGEKLCRRHGGRQSTAHLPIDRTIQCPVEVVTLCKAGRGTKEVCNKKVHSNGFCIDHQHRLDPVCKFDSCGNKSIFRRGLCAKHYYVGSPKKRCIFEACTELARRGGRTCEAHADKVCFGSIGKDATHCDSTRLTQRWSENLFCQKHRAEFAVRAAASNGASVPSPPVTNTDEPVVTKETTAPLETTLLPQPSPPPVEETFAVAKVMENLTSNLPAAPTSESVSMSTFPRLSNILALDKPLNAIADAKQESEKAPADVKFLKKRPAQDLNEQRDDDTASEDMERFTKEEKALDVLVSAEPKSQFVEATGLKENENVAENDVKEIGLEKNLTAEIAPQGLEKTGKDAPVVISAEEDDEGDDEPSVHNGAALSRKRRRQGRTTNSAKAKKMETA